MVASLFPVDLILTCSPHRKKRSESLLHFPENIFCIYPGTRVRSPNSTAIHEDCA